MVKNKALKGSLFENLLLDLAINKYVVQLAMRGASSKSRSNNQNLKIDLMMIRNNKLYIIQAKNWNKPASKPSIARFYASTFELSTMKLDVVPKFIQNKKDFEELLG